MLMEAFLGWLVTVWWVLRRALFGGVVVLLARVEVVHLTVLRVVALGVMVAVSLTLLVVAADDVSVAERVLEYVRTHLLPFIFFTA